MIEHGRKTVGHFIIAANQKFRNRFHRALRRRQANPHRALLGNAIEPLQAQRKMRTSFISCQAVNFIDNNRLNRFEMMTAFGA